MPTAILETQPHSTEAEQTVIGALLLDPEAIFGVAIVDLICVGSRFFLGVLHRSFVRPIASQTIPS